MLFWFKALLALTFFAAHGFAADAPIVINGHTVVPEDGLPLAERSVGTPDPGAISLGLIVTAIGGVLGEAEAAAPGAARSTNKEGQSV